MSVGWGIVDVGELVSDDRVLRARIDGAPRIAARIDQALWRVVWVANGLGRDRGGLRRPLL